MARKTSEEKLAALEAKMEQLQNQKKKLLTEQKEQARKERTRRLIQIGAEVEAALGYELDSEETRKAFGDFIRQQEAKGKWATKAIQSAINNTSENA